VGAGPGQRQHSRTQLSRRSALPPCSSGLAAALQPDVDAVIDILLDVDLSAGGTAAGDAATAAGQPYPRLGRWPPHVLSMQCDLLPSEHTAARPVPAARPRSNTLSHRAAAFPGCPVCALRLADPAALVAGGTGSRGVVPPPVTLPPPGAHPRPISPAVGVAATAPPYGGRGQPAQQHWDAGPRSQDPRVGWKQPHP
jgi:hypothetical protein